MRVYQGSGADFDAFDNSHMGEITAYSLIAANAIDNDNENENVNGNLNERRKLSTLNSKLFLNLSNRKRHPFAWVPFLGVHFKSCRSLTSFSSTLFPFQEGC